MLTRLSVLIAVISELLLASSTEAKTAAPKPLLLRGTALSGAEFAPTSLPGNFGSDYIYPVPAEVDYFIGTMGMTVLRVPFLWERMQPRERAELRASELSHLSDLVNYATQKGASVILDPQNGARYYGAALGAGVSDEAFADFWRRLALAFKDNRKVIFGLMNEPHEMPTEHWQSAAQAAVTAIRATGAKNLILIPGNAWSGAWTWTNNSYGTPNAIAMLKIKDPANNSAFEVHQYLDADGSGSGQSCVDATIGSTRLKEFTAWLRQNHKRGFVGELAAPHNPVCAAALEDMLKFLEANSDVYLGWAWWSAGPWWGNYPLSIEPTRAGSAPLLALLGKHLPTPKTPAKEAPAKVVATPTSARPAPSLAPPPLNGGHGMGAVMALTSEWETGYCAGVQIKNGGYGAIHSWLLKLDPKGGVVTKFWSSTFAKDGKVYKVTPVDFTAHIAAGRATEFGFCADKGPGGGVAGLLSVDWGS